MVEMSYKGKSSKTIELAVWHFESIEFDLKVNSSYCTQKSEDYFKHVFLSAQ